MATLKSFEPQSGHHWNGEGMPQNVPVDSLLRVAAATLRSGGGTTVYRAYYIGEPGMLDVDITKIGCEECRRKLERL